jgi:hypothetical protein
MPRPDFVRKMKKELDQQREKNDRNQQEKLHDAAVIQNQGSQKWEELEKEVQDAAKQIGIVYEKRNGDTFSLGSLTTYLEIRFNKNNATITCSDGKKDKTFYLTVSGQDLMYSEFPVTSARFLGAGTLHNVVSLAETLIEKAITSPGSIE